MVVKVRRVVMQSVSETDGIARIAPSQLLRCRFPAADRGYSATRYEASEPEHIRKSVPIVRWTASAIFNAPEGGKVDGPQRSSVLRIEMGLKGTISIGLCQFEGMAEAKGHKMEMVVKVFTAWDAGVSDGGRLLR